HVIDVSSPSWEEQRTVVEQVLDDLGVNDRPKLFVFNKIDLLDDVSLVAVEERVRSVVPASVFVSSVADGGLDPLRRALATATRARRPLSEIRMSPADGRLLAEIHRGAEVLGQRMEGERLIIDARVDDALAGRIRRAGAEVTTRSDSRTIESDSRTVRQSDRNSNGRR